MVVAYVAGEQGTAEQQGAGVVLECVVVIWVGGDFLDVWIFWRFGTRTR
jgi:hypothetical protein